MHKKVAFYTLGCKANQYDTEVMKEALRAQEGYKVVPFEGEADVFVINTCSVTGGADRKSRKYARRAAKREGLVIVTGCYVTLNADRIEEIEGIDLFFSNPHKNEIVEILQRVEEGYRGRFKARKYRDWNLDNQIISRDESHTRGFVKIQDGCSNSCSFCKVRYLRGPTRSKSSSRVLAEARKLGGNGFREIVLTGINLAEYGDQDSSLANLIQELSKVESITRIRLSSINPRGITENLLEVFEELEETCPYFHLSLQSGSNRILEKMNRNYSRETYLKKIEMIEDKLPGATFGTDFMVGFPGETTEDFQQTKKLVKEVGFVNCHVFRYSPREVTPAADFDRRVDSSLKKRRSEELRDLASSVSRREREAFKGEELEMIIEEPSNRVEGWRGYSKNYLDLHLPARDRMERLDTGCTVNARVAAVKEDFCLGEVAKASRHQEMDVQVRPGSKE